MGSMPASDGPFEVAIVGGGIVSLILAAGLHRRSVPVKVYEQSSTFRESGAGIGFNIAAKSCMEMIDPGVITALRLCGGVPISALDPDDPHDYLRWVDGFSQGIDNIKAAKDKEWDITPGGWQRQYMKADAGYKGIEGTRRDHFLEQMGQLFPPGVIHFNKKLETLADPEDGSKITLTFTDGTIATADAVIGCDGIRSRTRDFVLNQSSTTNEGQPTYTNVRSARVLVPMAAAIDALGKSTASIYYNHIGPGANLLHYPVAQNTLVNVALFYHDANEWPEDVSWTVRQSPRSEIETAFQDWHPRIRSLLQKMPESVPVMGLFDMFEHPLSHYNNGRICVAGDAAHASTPHHGAGAGTGIEDALCLAILMAEVAGTVRIGGVSKAQAVATAFKVYDSMRRSRSQWLVNSSRRVCDLQHNPDFADPAKRVGAETCFEEIMDRTQKIWSFDFMGMIRQSTEKYGRAVNALRVPI